ncbi:MAG: helix-turn-helix domain-containing protein [Propionicimonas sp.]|uniref:helix-turn-helix domain-containing protein n=1 Tax=Propionicimonas sp. TaxID=1955623 RepID=UPI003D12B94B
MAAEPRYQGRLVAWSCVHASSSIDSTKPGAFISLSAAADILGISVHTLLRRIAAGELPAFRTCRRINRVRASDLDKLLRRVPSANGW